jgi:hypothetical protein
MRSSAAPDLRRHIAIAADQKALGYRINKEHGKANTCLYSMRESNTEML